MARDIFELKFLTWKTNLEICFYFFFYRMVIVINMLNHNFIGFYNSLFCIFLLQVRSSLIYVWFFYTIFRPNLLR